MAYGLKQGGRHQDQDGYGYGDADGDEAREQVPHSGMVVVLGIVRVAHVIPRLHATRARVAPPVDRPRGRGVDSI